MRLFCRFYYPLGTSILLCERTYPNKHLQLSHLNSCLRNTRINMEGMLEEFEAKLVPGVCHERSTT